MPNLNIRGRGGAFGYRRGATQTSGISGALPQRRSKVGSTNRPGYGLSKIHNSDSRLPGAESNSTSGMPPPNAIPRMARNQLHQQNIPSRRSIVPGQNGIGVRVSECLSIKGTVNTLKL